MHKRALPGHVGQSYSKALGWSKGRSWSSSQNQIMRTRREGASSGYDDVACFSCFASGLIPSILFGPLHTCTVISNGLLLCLRRYINKLSNSSKRRRKLGASGKFKNTFLFIDATRALYSIKY